MESQPSRKWCLTSKLAGAVAGHAQAALALIVVLAVLVVGLYVYYHGVWVLGPYAAASVAAGAAGGSGGSPKRKAAAKAVKAAAKAPADEDDPETERLIDAINS